MDTLKAALTSLAYPDQRTKKALIAELLPAIESTHQMGFTLITIHAEITTVLPMPYATFASCLHRIRQSKKTLPASHSPESSHNPQARLATTETTETDNVSTRSLSVEARRRLSAKKLEQFEAEVKRKARERR